MSNTAEQQSRALAVATDALSDIAAHPETGAERATQALADMGVEPTPSDRWITRWEADADGVTAILVKPTEPLTGLLRVDAQADHPDFEQAFAHWWIATNEVGAQAAAQQAATPKRRGLKARWSR